MKKILSAAALLTVVLAVAGCNKHDNDPWYYATVTCRPAGDGSFYMKLDDTTALVSSNVTKYPYKGEKRATIFYYIDKDVTPEGIPGYRKTWSISLTSIDTMLVKQPVQSLGTFKADSAAFGNELVGLVLDGSVFPPTMIEDGYLCLSFPFYASGFIPHVFNLVTGVDPERPYLVEFRHFADEDDPLYKYKGHIEFPLKGLPDTEGKTVDLTLRWNNLATGKPDSTVFKYCSRPDWPAE